MGEVIFCHALLDPIDFCFSPLWPLLPYILFFVMLQLGGDM